MITTDKHLELGENIGDFSFIDDSVEDEIGKEMNVDVLEVNRNCRGEGGENVEIEIEEGEANPFEEHRAKDEAYSNFGDELAKDRVSKTNLQTEDGIDEICYLIDVSKVEKLDAVAFDVLSNMMQEADGIRVYLKSAANRINGIGFISLERSSLFVDMVQGVFGEKSKVRFRDGSGWKDCRNAGMSNIRLFLRPSKGAEL